jgi:hypothetical protein
MRPLPTYPSNRSAGQADARPTRSGLIAFGLAALLAVPAFAAKTGQRFAVEAELRPLALSTDGRFAIEAEARFTPEANSADGRFALKAVNVPAGGCEAFPDPLFSNGFEAP